MPAGYTVSNPYANNPLFGGNPYVAPRSTVATNEEARRRQYGNPATFHSGYSQSLAPTTTTTSPMGNVPPLPPPSPYTFQDPVALAMQMNQLMIDQVKQLYQQSVPQYEALRNQQSAVVGQQLGGQVPVDVKNQLIQGAAERGISTGSPGSPNSNAAYLRALGLTSAGLQQQGVANLNTAIEQTPVPELVNPASIIVPERAGYLELLAYLNATAPKAVTSSGPGFSNTQYLTPQSPGFSFYGQPYKPG